MLQINEYSITQPPTIVKKRDGFFVLPDDPGQPITPDQIDELCDLYLEINKKEPSRKKLSEYGNLTKMQAEIKIKIFQKIDAIHKDDPKTIEQHWPKSRATIIVLREYGYRPYKPQKLPKE